MILSYKPVAVRVGTLRSGKNSSRGRDVQGTLSNRHMDQGQKFGNTTPGTRMHYTPLKRSKYLRIANVLLHGKDIFYTFFYKFDYYKIHEMSAGEDNVNFFTLVFSYTNSVRSWQRQQREIFLFSCLLQYVWIPLLTMLLQILHFKLRTSSAN